MKPCPECNSTNLYQYKEAVEAGGAYGPNLLPKLESRWFSSAKFLPVVCADCGFVRLYASKESRDKLKESKHWRPL